MSYINLLQPYLQSGAWIIDSGGVITTKEIKDRIYYWVLNYEIIGENSAMAEFNSLDALLRVNLYGTPNGSNAVDWTTYELYDDSNTLIYSGTFTSTSDYRLAMRRVSDYVITNNLILPDPIV